jgi:hypothetical protein
MKTIVLALLLSTSVAADTVTRPPRFQMMERKTPTGETWFIKLDTESGRSWRLEQRSGETVWLAIRDVEAPAAKPQTMGTLERRVVIHSTATNTISD